MSWPALVVLVLLAPVAAQADPATYSVCIQEGLQPRMSASAVAGMARSTPVGRAAVDWAGSDGSSGSKVVSVECIDGQEIRSAYSHPSMHSDAPIWIVRMHGTFIESRTGGGPARVKTKAYYVVDDATGEVIGFGSSSARRASSPPSLDKFKRGR